MLYAFFDLGLAISGDFGIAISFATSGSVVRSSLRKKLTGYPDAEKVPCCNNVVTWRSKLTIMQIISESLKDLKFINNLPSKIQHYVLDSLITSAEVAFGTYCAMTNVQAPLTTSRTLFTCAIDQLSFQLLCEGNAQDKILRCCVRKEAAEARITSLGRVFSPSSICLSASISRAYELLFSQHQP